MCTVIQIKPQLYLNFDIAASRDCLLYSTSQRRVVVRRVYDLFVEISASDRFSPTDTETSCFLREKEIIFRL